MVVTNDDEQARTIRMLRDWGQEKRYHYVLKGSNYRLEGIHGAIFGVKLRHLEGWTETRRARAREYVALLEHSPAVKAARQLDRRRHGYHIYAVRTADRDGLQKQLQADGVSTGLHYPISIHRQQAHRDLGRKAGDVPQSEAAANEVLSLPMFPKGTSSQVGQVVAAVEQKAHAR
jgi:dTDP-4-amino-4,6-dideoxygalactose transaminase